MAVISKLRNECHPNGGGKSGIKARKGDALPSKSVILRTILADTHPTSVEGACTDDKGLHGISLASVMVNFIFFRYGLPGHRQECELKSGSNTAIPRRSCGKCGKTIKLREQADSVLCTVTLELVDPAYVDVCVHYEDRNKSPDQFCSGRP